MSFSGMRGDRAAGATSDFRERPCGFRLRGSLRREMPGRPQIGDGLFGGVLSDLSEIIEGQVGNGLHDYES